MANKDAPFGFRPAKMLGGAPFTGGQTSYGIESGYSSNNSQEMLLNCTQTEQLLSELQEQLI